MTPALTVVIAAVNSARTVPRCLAALAPQASGGRVEVLLVAADDDRAAAAAGADFAFVRPVAVGGRPLVPELWGVGVARARGPIVALTISACVPAASWVDALIAAHRLPHAAVGGPIAPAAGAGLVDLAVFLVRYTPYMPPIVSGPVDEVPGDNGSYKRDAIGQRLEDIEAHGFWEADINRDLRRAGATLWMDAAAIVTHRESFSFAGFSRQRFAHGRRFGATNGRGLSGAARLVRVAAAPLVPLVMLRRIVQRVLRQRRLRLALVVTLPIVVWFLVCWAAGEGVGVLRG